MQVLFLRQDIYETRILHLSFALLPCIVGELDTFVDSTLFWTQCILPSGLAGSGSVFPRGRGRFNVERST